MKNKLSQENVSNIYRGDIIGREFVYYESTTSTNDRAFEIGRKLKHPEGLVVIADSQTRGRGRLGRTWISPSGVNLYFTVLLAPPFAPGEAYVFTLAAPVAVVRAIRDHTGLKANIKWPNDIMLSDKKAGGILLETKYRPDRRAFIAVGIGINVNMAVTELPPDIRDLSTSLKSESGKSQDRLRLLGGILAGLEDIYKNLLKGDKRALINEWLGLNSTIGRDVSVREQDRIITGTADGITDKGELLIRLPSGKIETVRAGDVTVLKK